jgi:hypothetical protein
LKRCGKVAVLCLCVVIEGGKTFPKDDVLRKKWIVAIRRRDESNRGKLWSPSASSPVCHKHFTEDVFIKTNQAGKLLLSFRRIMKSMKISAHYYNNEYY